MREQLRGTSQGPAPPVTSPRVSVDPRASLPAAVAPPRDRVRRLIDDPRERGDPLAGLLARAVAQRNSPPPGVPRPPSSHRVLARTVIKNGSAKFRFKRYKILDPGNGTNTARSVALDVKIGYEPASTTRSKKIGFVQVLKSLRGGASYHLGVGQHRATGDDSGDAGWELDRTQGVTSPIYGQADDGGTLGNTGFGSRNRSWWSTSAWLTDQVRRNRAVDQTHKIDFVTYAFDETNSVYLGGVSWGLAVDAAGNTTAKKPALHEAGAPTGAQKQALVRWNEQADLDDVGQRNAPNQEKVVVP